MVCLVCASLKGSHAAPWHVVPVCLCALICYVHATRLCDLLADRYQAEQERSEGRVPQCKLRVSPLRIDKLDTLNFEWAPYVRNWIGLDCRETCCNGTSTRRTIKPSVLDACSVVRLAGDGKQRTTVGTLSGVCVCAFVTRYMQQMFSGGHAMSNAGHGE